MEWKHEKAYVLAKITEVLVSNDVPSIKCSDILSFGLMEGAIRASEPSGLSDA